MQIKAAEEGSTNVAVQSLETQLQFVNTSHAAYKEVDDNLGVHVCFRFTYFLSLIFDFASIINLKVERCVYLLFENITGA